MEKREGLFITFEGGDGAGKSTLTENLYHYLLKKKRAVIKTRAPGGTKLGEKIRALLLDERELIDERCELFLFLADRAQHVEEVIKPSLREGKIVLCDRFNDSTVAYQGAARGLDPSRVKAFCDFAVGGLKPDLTFYLDIDPSFGLARSVKKSGSTDRLESEALFFHQKLRAAFHDLAKEEPSRIYTLDGTLSPEMILEKTVKIVYEFF